MKIYTKTGDKGTTGLVDGSRISKGDERIEALGSLDEANAEIGLLLTTLAADNESYDLLLQAQSMLFVCGSRIAEPTKESQLGLSLPDKAFIGLYEHAIDAMTTKLPALTSFILPGGTELAAYAHVARAVVRRAERSLVRLKESGDAVDDEILQWLNRLSDWLFTLARYYNYQEGVDDIIWENVKKG